MRIVQGTVLLGAVCGGVAFVLALLLDGRLGAAFGVGSVAAVLGMIGGFTATAAAADQRQYRLVRRVPVPEQTIRAWAQFAYPRWGWVLTGREPHGLIFLRQAKPDPWLAVFLLLLGVVPAVICLAIGGKTVTTSVSTRPVGPNETDLEVVASERGWDGARMAMRFFNGLHEVESP